jgi:hypothetical protein
VTFRAKAIHESHERDPLVRVISWIVLVPPEEALIRLRSAGSILFEHRMRIKITFGLLALAVAVLLSGYVYLSVSAGRRLQASEYARFSSTIAKSATHPSEGGASRAVALSRQALSSTVASGSIDVAGRSFSFPLPRYAVPQEQTAGRLRFLAFVSPDEMQDYFNRALPAAGWKQVDQMGSGHFLAGHAAQMTIVQHFYLTDGISEFNVLISVRQ